MPKCADPFPFGECQICQDKATGIHYGVAACQGCKGFFKRSMVRNTKYVCYTGGNCPINTQTRSRCKACRYRRCMETGMSMGSIKMGRIPKAQKELALANLHDTADEDQGPAHQWQDGKNVKRFAVKQGGAAGLLPNLTKVVEELDKLESTSSSSQKAPLDCSALHPPQYLSSNTSFVPIWGNGRQRERQESQSLCRQQTSVNRMTAEISQPIDDKCPKYNSWVKVNNSLVAPHTVHDSIGNSAIQNVQTGSTSSNKCLDIMPKSASPIHFSSEVITELIHQVRQQPSSSRTDDMLTQLFGSDYHGPGAQPGCGVKQHTSRPLQLTQMEIMHSTIRKLLLIETGLESDIITMNAEIAGTLQPHRLNMLKEATREDAFCVWDELFESIPICTDKLLKFCRQIPGMSVLGSSQMDLLIRKNYFEIWILLNSDLFCRGDFYLRFPGGGRYSLWWMKLILPKEIVDSMLNICTTLEYYKVPQLLRKIMCAIILFGSSNPYLESADNTDYLHGHYLDILGEAVQNQYGSDDKRIILEMFKLMSSLKHLALKMATVVGDYTTGQLPDTCIQYLSEKAADVLVITSIEEQESIALDNSVM